MFLNVWCNITTYEMMNLKALPYMWRARPPPNSRYGGLRFPLTKLLGMLPTPHDSYDFDAADKVYFNEFDCGVAANLASLFAAHPAASAKPKQA